MVLFIISTSGKPWKCTCVSRWPTSSPFEWSASVLPTFAQLDHRSTSLREAYFNFSLNSLHPCWQVRTVLTPRLSNLSWFLIDLGKYWLWLEFPFQEVKERSRSRAGATSRNRLWSRTISRGKDCWAVAASKKDRPVKPCSTSSIQDILQCRTVLFIALPSGHQLVTNCTKQLEDWLALRINSKPIKPTWWHNGIPSPTHPPSPRAPLAAPSTPLDP